MSRLSQFIRSFRRPPAAVPARQVLAESADEQIVQFHHDGLTYKLVTNSAQDIYHRGIFENAGWSLGYEVLARLAPRDRIVLDLGANIGTFAVPMASAGFKVLAYEADPANVSFLARACQANRLRSLEIRQRAVWDCRTTLKFATHSAWGQVNAGGNLEVDAVRLDDDLGNSGPVGAIKIDVEGSETRALSGLRTTIERDRPHIMFECNPLAMVGPGGDVEGLFKTMSGCGYRFCRVVERFRVLAPRAGPQEVLVADYLATTLPEDRLKQRSGLPVRALTPDETLQSLKAEATNGLYHQMYSALSAQSLIDIRTDPDFAAALEAVRQEHRDHHAYVGMKKAAGL